MKKNFSFFLHSQNGQLLLEVIIAGMIIIFVSLAITQGIASALRGISQTASKTTAAYLSRELVEALRAIAFEDWHSITALSTSTAYSATTSVGTKWTAVSGAENVTVNNIVYSRSFSLSEVCRNESTKAITDCASGYIDSSTIKATTTVSGTDAAGRPIQFGQAIYLSRYGNTVFPQTDWSSGTSSAVFNSASGFTYYATSSGIDATGTAGQFMLQAQ